MIAVINHRIGAKDSAQPGVLSKRIAYFGDSMTNGSAIDYPYKIYSLNGIAKTNYGLSGTSVCTGTFAPVGGNSNLIDLYTTETALGYIGQLVSFAYLQNDSTLFNASSASWKATYKSIIQAFISAGWPVTKLLIMNEPCLVANQSAPRTALMAAISAIATELGILYYDVYQRFIDTGVNDSLFMDSIHPSDAGQDVWAQGYYTFIRR